MEGPLPGAALLVLRPRGTAAPARGSSRGRGLAVRPKVRKAMLLIRETNTGVRAFCEKIGYGSAPRVVMQRWL